MGIPLATSRRGNPKALVLAIVTFAALSIVNYELFYVGFLSSDDAIYVHSARSLAAPGHYLPTQHWGFRYTVLLPIAGLEAMLADPKEPAYSLIPLSFALALGIATVAFAWATIGGRASIATALLMSTMPLAVVLSSMINADSVETLCLFLSLALFFFAARRETSGRRAWLFLSGTALGLAMLTRETAYGFLLIYGTLFLFGAYFPRKNYLWLAAGVVLVAASEMGYYVALGESPLYRFLSIAQSHGTVGLTTLDFQTGTGNLSHNRFLGPIVALLANQEFGILFPVAAVALVWIRIERCPTAADNAILGLTLFAALVFFLWLGYSGAIRPLPRYFLLLAVLAVIWISLWFQRTRFGSWGMLALIGLVATNYVALSVENIHPRFASNKVAELAMSTTEPVMTDAQTASRARQYAGLLRNPAATRIVSELPQQTPFTLVQVAGQEVADPRLAAELSAAKTRGALLFVEEIQPPRLPIGQVLDRTGVGSLLTAEQYRWLAIRNPQLSIFRVLEIPPSASH